MKVHSTQLPGVLLIELAVFGDERGFFFESYREERYATAGIDARFVQDSFSRSRRGVLRGLHFQEPSAQGKLVQVLRGSVYDVAVDVRRSSPHFGKWVGLELRAEAHCQVWIPPGFAHGFYVTSDEADFLYKSTAPHAPAHEQAIRWNDPALGITWPTASPTLSAKDAAAPALRDVRMLPL